MGTISTVTIGSDTFSVYALTADPVVDATSYFNGMLGAEATAWTAATADNKKRALVMAADWIDRAAGQKFSGEQSVDGQPREFPRDGLTYWTVTLPDGTTPNLVAQAEFYLAGLLLVDASLAAGTGTGSNIKEVQAGPAKVSFFSSTVGTSKDTRLPIKAMDYLKGFFAGIGTGRGAGVATGVDCDSAFNAEDFQRDEGFS